MKPKPEPKKASAAKPPTGRVRLEKCELSTNDLDQVAGGINKLPGRWKVGEVTLTRG